jgi:hypothetical protein
MNWPNRRAAIGGLLSSAPAVLFGAAWAQQPSVSGDSRPASVEDGEIVMSLDTWTDTYGRPTASVMLNGRGPFAFLVDTGSTITVISERLAHTLGAVSAGAFTVTGATGTAVRPFTFVETLQAGDVRLNKLRVAVMSDARLARCDGILGADVFAGKRLVFSVRDKVVRVEPSLRLASATPRNLRLRHGLLAEVDGRVGKIPTKLMLDTGADYCVANPVLGEALRKAHPWQGRIPHVRIVGVTGHRVSGEFIYLPPVDARAFSVQDSGAVIADAQIFKLWELESEPAMIVGVDLLSRLASFTIDYGARTFDAQLAMGMELIARNEGGLS